MIAEKVTLGDHEVDVYPQRHAYLTNGLARLFTGLAKSGVSLESAQDFVSFMGDGMYDVLCVILPQYGKRCPLYEFMGYDSQAAMDSGKYDEQLDKSPTLPEMIAALEKAKEVNRLDVVSLLGKVFDPNLVRSAVNQKMAEALTTSVNSRSVADGALSGSSTETTHTTEMETPDGLGSESTPSPQPDTPADEENSVSTQTP
jgi:uncharacterized protein YejL (UPF0352 family)